MCRDLWRLPAVLVLALTLGAPLAAQKHTPPRGALLGISERTVDMSHWHAPAGLTSHAAGDGTSSERLRPIILALDEHEGGLPRWVRWGIVGAAAGAVTFPFLSGLASDSRGSTARAAAVGAVSGFVIVGGSVALWDLVCAGPTRSRRAGLCGGR